MKAEEQSRIRSIHANKLNKLGFHANNKVTGTINNLSSRKLTKVETDILAKGLTHSFYPMKLQLNSIKVEFEHLYCELKPWLIPKHA